VELAGDGAKKPLPVVVARPVDEPVQAEADRIAITDSIREGGLV